MSYTTPYKWCVVPQCTNTSLNNIQKLFVTVPKNSKKRKLWLALARRSKSISPLSNVFMCEDHFDIEKDAVNYVQLKMGYCKKILMADDAVPTRLHCQNYRESRLPDCSYSRGAFLKRQRINLITECPQIQSTTETQKSLQKDDDMIQETIEPEGQQPEALLKHIGFTCNLCYGAIYGYRYSCVECVNFDLCARCETNREHEYHYMLRVPEPRPEDEVKAVMADLRAALERRAVHHECEVEVKYEPGSDDEEDIKPFDPLHVLIGDTKQCGSGVGPCVPTGPAVDPLAPAAPGTAGGAQTPALAVPTTSHTVVAPPRQLSMLVHPVKKKTVRANTGSTTQSKGEVKAVTEKRKSTSEQTVTFPRPLKIPKQEPWDADSGDTADRPCTADPGSSKEDDLRVFTTQINRDEEDDEFDSGVS